MKNLIYIAFLMITHIILAQQTPASPQTTSILITGATIHIGNGTVVENGAVGFNDGKITYVGSASAVDKNEFSQVIDAVGKHIYPGFIALNSTLGLVEIDAVRATDDEDEIGSLLPHIRSLIAYNAESKVVESMRPNGVLMGQVTPRGGSISGTSSVVQFDAWNWEDAAIKVDDAIHMNWPNSLKRGRPWRGEDPGLKPNEDYTKEIDGIIHFLMEAKAYLAGNQNPRNLPYEATKGLFDGTQKLFIHVDGKREITDAVNFAKKAGIEKIVVVGGDQADEVSGLLASNNIPVVVKRPHRLPSSDDENIKHTFMLASLLSKAGVLCSIDPSGSMERMNTRNLPFYAGSFAAYGMAKEQAVQLITENAAKIAGVDKLVGTIETGKDATLFISEGDALDMRTNIISKAYIQGRDISLETHQTELWKRYTEKYGKK
ncbi:amidohydrolase family protein [Galbibacter pacificus]|uniref:Amidohydrolase family protein n=1 Tax=Galbibacter pacificus TaxID=2996052 RepID=A0ABT6FNG1_9FLAO|nr:amidohydrolase family protein [Galbibacter pacificus]MDG3581327.1 amidohydrolase family protein [Galbibacter pacificus]MDG3584805.1 amidohydrolase family protein [Galbibacter pacificus]